MKQPYSVHRMARLTQPLSIDRTGILFLPLHPRSDSDRTAASARDRRRSIHQAALRKRHMIDRERGEECHNRFDLTGFDYAVLEDPNSLLRLTEKAFGNERLEHIGQWGLLEWSIVEGDYRDPISTHRSPHRRRGHMRDAYALMVLITERMRLPRWVKIVLRIAALTHDVFTIAGGDTMKQCAPKELHEELIYQERLDQTGWLELAKHFGLPETKARKLLVDTVQGRGPYRDLMKLVDWMAYVARDAVVYRNISAPQEETARFMEDHPRACGFWESIHITNGQIHLTDIDQYITLARLRMRLYHEVYLSANMRYKEFLIAGVVGRALYEDGEITKDLLLRWTDHDLDKVLCEAMGVASNYELDRRVGRPHVELFQTGDEARRREQQLLAEGVKLVFVEDLSNYRIRPGLDFLFKTDDGSLTPFHELRLDIAEELTRASRLTDPVRLYYVRNTDLPPKLVVALDRYHERRRHNPHSL